MKEAPWERLSQAETTAAMFRAQYEALRREIPTRMQQNERMQKTVLDFQLQLRENGKEIAEANKQASIATIKYDSLKRIF